MSTKQEILDVLHRNQSEMTALGISRIGLFGAFVRGEEAPESGLDLLVEFAPDQKSFDTMMDLCLLLEKILPHKFDLVTMDTLHPKVAPRILQEVEYAAAAPK
jgi:predicted nucleotidyltransferase